jgi:hypothetical protein
MGNRYLGTTNCFLSPEVLEKLLRLGNAILHCYLWALKAHVDAMSEGLTSGRLVHLLLCLFYSSKANIYCSGSTQS